MRTESIKVIRIDGVPEQFASIIFDGYHKYEEFEDDEPIELIISGKRYMVRYSELLKAVTNFLSPR